MTDPSAPSSVPGRAPGPPPGAAPPEPAEYHQPVRPPYGEVRLSSGTTAKLRNPVVVAILVIVTLGIYQIVWWYLVNREMAEHGRALGRKDLGEDPARSTLALFPGGLIVVPAIWTTVTTFIRIQTAQRLHAQQPINGWLGFVLLIVFSPALIGYMQSGLNSAWSAALAPGTGTRS
jgi:hypothetical protein